MTAAKSWEISNGARAHIVLDQILTKGRYSSAWTEKTVEKLLAFGLVELADAPTSWRWGPGSKQVIITPIGKDAFFVAQNNGFVRVYPKAQGAGAQ